MNLRKQARGKPCQVRVPGTCCCDGVTCETTVASHYRLAGYCGMGLKPEDATFTAWACARCHDAIDGRLKTGWTRDELRLMHLEGVMRTQIERKKLEVEA